jgi:hypothetical protein
MIYPLHVSNRVTIHYQDAVTVYAAYGIYHPSANTIRVELSPGEEYLIFSIHVEDRLL